MSNEPVFLFLSIGHIKKVCPFLKHNYKKYNKNKRKTLQVICNDDFSTSSNEKRGKK